MKNTIELTKEEYQELLDLVFLGENIKTMHLIPENYEKFITHPSIKLRNKIFSQAKQFKSEHLIETQPELKGQYFLKTGDDLMNEYLGL